MPQSESPPLRHPIHLAGVDELFKTSGFLAASQAVLWTQLPPFIRVLLSTDGTVTKSLESYFWEPVAVLRRAQRVLDTHERLKDFDVADALWLREVDLVGVHSQRCFARAISYVRFTLLPDDLRQQLERDELGIGGIIRALELETYRKIVAVGQQPAMPAQPKCVWRSYHLYYRNQVLMHITETFDLSAFA